MTEEELYDEIVRLITTGEVERVSIVGQSANDATLDPLTDAEEIIKVMGLNSNIIIEQDAKTNQISWTVHSIGTATKGGLKDGNEN
ncbi:hypothetical protein [Ruminiclostridium cellobioparum]|uniref:hypothetical protein n=1 Tax=Ruminiclostridium cellobioparum TaxID=29355 RepID=UPI00047FD6D8|nr:hypothetical protein [Ruminiclostridium cellobioparum]